MGSYIVRARIDGRGGGRVFGLIPKLSKHFIGKMFRIGDTDIPVTTDGRINIPKEIMDRHGILGVDGRKRITITYSSNTNREGDMTYGAFVNKPLSKDKNRDNNWRTVTLRKKTKRGLKPKDSPDYNWSHIE